MPKQRTTRNQTADPPTTPDETPTRKQEWRTAKPTYEPEDWDRITAELAYAETLAEEARKVKIAADTDFAAKTATVNELLRRRREMIRTEKGRSQIEIGSRIGLSPNRVGQIRRSKGKDGATV
jgi:hypothetical protein